MVEATKKRRLLCDEIGAVTIDWVTLTAGIVLLGIIVVFSVMENSAGYLMAEFEILNAEIEASGVAISENSKGVSFE